MPDLTDLQDAFARLEQEIPDHYRSPVIHARLARLAEPADGRVHTLRAPRPRTLAAALLAAAAVAALAVTLTIVGGGANHREPVGNQPTTGQQSSAPPSAATTPPQRPSTSPVADGTMPASASALIGYVQGGAPVPEDGYQQGAAQTGQPMQPTPGVTEFTTPSGNISCGMSGTAVLVGLECSVARHSYVTPPKPASCDLNWGSSWLSIESGSVVEGLCLGGPPFDPISRVLPYGSTLQHGSLACRSESAFLACADLSTGHGFAVSRTTLKTY